MKKSNLYSTHGSPTDARHQCNDYIKTNARDAISNSSDYYNFFPFEEDLSLEYVDFIYETGSHNCISVMSKSHFKHKEMTVTSDRDDEEIQTEKWKISNQKLVNSSNEVHIDFSIISEGPNKKIAVYNSISANSETVIHQFTAPQNCPNIEKFSNIKCIKTLETIKWDSGESCNITRFFARNLGLIYEEKRHYFASKELGAIESRALDQIL